MDSKPTCVKCRRKMEVVFGIPVLEYMDKEMTQPYKLWNADIGECPDCGNQVAYRYAPRAYMEHFQPGFDAEVEKLKKAHGFGIKLLVEVY